MRVATARRPANSVSVIVPSVASDLLRHLMSGVTARRLDPQVSGFRSSIGVGLAIRTPFSPLPFRIYFSRALTKNPTDQNQTIDFTLGTRF